MSQPSDRRQHSRLLVIRDGKVREPVGGRCLPCRTVNLSEGGALLCVRGGEGLPEGHTVQFALDWPGRGEPIRLDDMLEATIIRKEAVWQGTVVLALRFTKAAADVATLARAA